MATRGKAAAPGKPQYRVLADTVSVRVRKRVYDANGRMVDPGSNDFVQWVKGDLMLDYPEHTNIASLLNKGAIEPVGKLPPASNQEREHLGLGEPPVQVGPTLGDGESGDLTEGGE